jgi:TolB-like protein
LTTEQGRVGGAEVTVCSGAVFLSYSSDDADAAVRIGESLRAAGVEVWLDQSELKTGDAWDATIRNQIKNCALFVPLISAHSNARSEGYFRLEWGLAVERCRSMADDHAFLIPVTIDDIPQSSARVPDRFRERQWTHLERGVTTPAFVEQVKRLLSGATIAKRAANLPHPMTLGSASKRRRLVAGAILCVAILTGMIGITLWNGRLTNVAARKVTPPEAPARDVKAVAVLPFENLSGRAEDAYLADGLQEEILNALARVRDLKVISRTSVLSFRGNPPSVREIGERLGVTSVLEGSIRREGNTLRLTVQLIDARDDRHLLAANYDRDLSHVLSLQSTVARQVATALAATLTRYERGEFERVATNNGDAYNFYLRAVASFQSPVPNDESRLIESKRLLEEALRLDPDFSEALALLSRVSTGIFMDNRSPAAAANAKQAFERALALDPQLPEAQLARGMYAIYVTDDLDRALDDLNAVIRVRPNSAEAHATLGAALRRRGRMDEALGHFTRSEDLDPLNHLYSLGPLTTLLGLRRYPEAIEEMKKHSKRFPNHPGGDLVRARIEAFLAHSIEPLRAALREHGKLLDAPDHKMLEAEIARAEGRYLDAVRLLEEVPDADPLLRGERLAFLLRAAGDERGATQLFRGVEHDARALRERGLVSTATLLKLATAQSLLGEHVLALATIEAARAQDPEALDATNGPNVSFVRSIILVRAGRSAEGYAEVTRLLRVPFGAPTDFIDYRSSLLLLLKDDSHYDELINHPPRL